MEAPDLMFVNLGITIQHLVNSVSIFGFRIAFYGIIIAIGIVAGLAVALTDVKRTGQDPDFYVDLTLFGVIVGVIGARIYYVIFAWDYYKDNPVQIFNIRAGGLAIYGGIIAVTIFTVVFCRIKHKNFFTVADTGVLGLVTGQMIGRWGNFFNCEAFGNYTDNLFAMRIKKSLVNPGMLNANVLAHQIVQDGVEYIQVHPTFLYESAWNFCLLLFLLWYRRHKSFEGEIMWLYFFGYGLGRFWIEGLRTDQLLLFGTGIPVSQLLSLTIMVISGEVLLLKHHRIRKEKTGK